MAFFVTWYLEKRLLYWRGICTGSLSFLVPKSTVSRVKAQGWSDRCTWEMYVFAHCMSKTFDFLLPKIKHVSQAFPRYICPFLLSLPHNTLHFHPSLWGTLLGNLSWLVMNIVKEFGPVLEKSPTGFYGSGFGSSQLQQQFGPHNCESPAMG